MEPGANEEEDVLLERLRHELNAPDRRRIRRLEDELTDPAKVAARVSDVLPRAVKASSERDKQLAWALQPTLETAIRETVRAHRYEFAEAIYPIIGPSIARAIKTAVAEMLQRINQALATRLSVQSVRWRIEAVRTGRSFAEVVLVRTLVYRVEQVLLVDRESGLLLGHVAGMGVEAGDPVMISALLTALNAFSREAFQAKQGLERLHVGDLSVWVESGARTMLAAVVRGTPPVELGGALHESLQKIQFEFAEALDTFQGDVAPFERARPLLEQCLKGEHCAASPRRAKWIGLGILAALVLAVALTGTLDAIAKRRFARTVAALRAEPGLVVVSAERHLRRDQVRGLRDPLARSPEEALKAQGFDPRHVDMSFTRFQSLDPAIVERRGRQVLDPPAGVSLSFEDGEVVASGRASAEWIERAKVRMAALDPSLRFSTEGLFTTESADEARAAAATLSRQSVGFAPGSAAVVPTSSAWRSAERSLREFFDAAERAGLSAFVEIYGAADPAGLPPLNSQLANARAENTRQALIDAGFPAERLRAKVSVRLERREVRFVGSLSDATGEAPPR